MAREPMKGMRKNVVPNVPTMLPAVEIPYTVPDTTPERCGERSKSRMANGEYMPRKVTGKNMIAIAAARLPDRTSSKAASTSSRSACANSGSRTR